MVGLDYCSFFFILIFHNNYILWHIDVVKKLYCNFENLNSVN